MWKFREVADGRGNGEFSAWRARLSSADRGVLDEKLKLLRDLGPSVSFWKGVTGYGRLNKLKIRARTLALRPIVCRGPAYPDREITLLLGAREENFDWDPRGAPMTAEGLRKAVIAKTRATIEYKVPDA